MFKKLASRRLQIERGSPHLAPLMQAGTCVIIGLLSQVQNFGFSEVSMCKVILYIAMSLDGYIADRDGGVAWLDGDGSDCGHPGSYPDFIQTVDTVVLGYRTYHQIISELSPENWVYRGLKSYVFTHRKLLSTEEILFTGRSPADLVAELKNSSSGIWVCGGSDIANQLLEAGLIDEFFISVIPTVLGGGVRLFTAERSMGLMLLSVLHYNGIVEMRYRLKETPDTV